MQFCFAEHLVERGAGPVQQVVQAIVTAGPLAHDVVAARGDDLDLRHDLGALAHRFDEARRAAGDVGDDERVSRVGLVLPVGFRHLLELARREVRDLEPHVLGHGHGQAPERPALIDGHEHALPERARLRERLADHRLVLRDWASREGVVAVAVERDHVVPRLADTTPQNTSYAATSDLFTLLRSLDGAGAVVGRTAFSRILRA